VSKRARALLTLHRDGVAAAMRLAPLPHDVFLQCYERTTELHERRNLTLTQLRACAALCSSSSSSLSSQQSYEEVLEIALFHVLLPHGERDAAVALLHADRCLPPEKRDLFARLVAAATEAQSSSLTPATNTGFASVDSEALGPRRLTFDEQQRQHDEQHQQRHQKPVASDDEQQSIDSSGAAATTKRILSSKRWWLLFLLGSSSVIAVYRAWLFWRSSSSRRALLK
jgi:hypothetical protein